MFALLAVALVFTFAPDASQAWSAWSNIHARLQVPGTSNFRDARGQFRDRLTGVICVGTVQAETTSNNARPVAIVGNSNVTASFVANMGLVAGGSALRTCGGNHTGWNLIN